MQVYQCLQDMHWNYFYRRDHTLNVDTIQMRLLCQWSLHQIVIDLIFEYKWMK